MFTASDALKETILMTAEFVPQDLKKVRLEICKGCDKFKRLARSCGICGCQMDLKVLYAKSECPQQKW